MAICSDFIYLEVQMPERDRVQKCTIIAPPHPHTSVDSSSILFFSHLESYQSFQVRWFVCANNRWKSFIFPYWAHGHGNCRWICLGTNLFGCEVSLVSPIACIFRVKLRCCPLVFILILISSKSTKTNCCRKVREVENENYTKCTWDVGPSLWPCNP